MPGASADPRAALTHGEVIAGVSALLLLILMFATRWYSVAGIPGTSAHAQAVTTENAWGALTVVRWLMLLTILAAGAAVAVHLAHASGREHPVLDKDGGQFAASHTKEGVARGRCCALFEDQGSVVVVSGSPERRGRRKEVPFPRRRCGRKSKARAIVTVAQTIAAGRLLVTDTAGKLGRTGHRRVLDGAVMDRWCDHRVAALPQSGDQGLQAPVCQDACCASGHHHGGYSDASSR